jgi:hypothetical protein
MEDGNRVEALWSDLDGVSPNVYTHGHIISNDGLNAVYVREPGGHVVFDDAQVDPYAHYAHPDHIHRIEGDIHHLG